MFSSSDEHVASGQSSPSSPASVVLPSPDPNQYSFPRIQLSPTTHEDDYRLSWDPPQEKVSYPLPSFRSLFRTEDDEHPLTSEYDASEYSEPDPVNDGSSTESEDEDLFFSDTRTTFFRTSAERLRPRHPLLRIAARTTSPAPSPVPSVIQRNISEPAPCTKTNTTDDVEEQPYSSPPLLPQPSSSPVLSPISLSASPMAGPVSPLFALESLSPLSLPPPSLVGDHDVAVDMDAQSPPQNDEMPAPMESIESDIGLGLFDSSPVPVAAPIPPASPPVAISELSAPVSDGALVMMVPPTPPQHHMAEDMAVDVDAVVPKKKKGTKQAQDPVKSKSEEKVVADRSKKRSNQSSLREEGPKPKKARVLAPDSSPEASGSRPLPQSRTKRGAVETAGVPPKGKKVSRTDARKPDRKGKRQERPRSPPPPVPPLPSKKSRQKVYPDIDPELCGMLIECMATSRASSLPMSTLYKTAMQSYPSLKSRGNERECLQVMERVLEGGTIAGGGSGVFGKVQGNVKGDSEQVLEAQWFYVPERDQDQDRAQLIRSMMPRPAKRGVTKELKQYYYRPLEKISRWDPEDEL